MVNRCTYKIIGTYTLHARNSSLNSSDDVRLIDRNVVRRVGGVTAGKAQPNRIVAVNYLDELDDEAEAIEYGKKSLGKPRYHFEAL